MADDLIDAVASDSRTEEEWLALMRTDLDAVLPRLADAALGGDAFAARSLAIVMRDRGRYEDAERWYLAAAKTDVGCAFGLADLLDKTGESLRAADWYVRSAAMGGVEAMANGGVLLTRLGDPRGAELLQEAVDHGDHVAEHFTERLEDVTAFLSACAGRLAEAEGPEQAVQVADELLDRYEDFRDFGRVEEAVAHFDRAAELAGHDEPLVLKAALFSRLGRWDDLHQSLEVAADLFPEGTAASFELGLMAREHGEQEIAERAFLRSAERGGVSSLWSLAVLYLRQRRLEEAERYYRAYGERTAEDEPRDWRAGLDRVAEYRAALAVAPPVPDGLRAEAEAGDPDAGVGLAGRLRERGEFGEALRWYRAAADRGDTVAAAAAGTILHDELGCENRHAVKWLLPAAEEAHARASRAEEPAAEDVALVERVGAFYVYDKESLLSEKWLRRAAWLGHARAAAWCGGRSSRYGDPQEAERLWAAAARGGDAWSGWRAGKAMVLRGAFAEAEPLLRIAWEGRDEEDPLHEAAYWLGRSLHGQGRLEEAADWLRTAVEVHPIVQLGYTGFMRTSLFRPADALAEVETAMAAD